MCSDAEGGDIMSFSIEGQQHRLIDVIASYDLQTREALDASNFGSLHIHLRRSARQIRKVAAVQSDAQWLVSEIVQCPRHRKEVGNTTTV